MDAKLREKTKAVFLTVLKNCEDQRKADVSDNQHSSTENSRQTTRRFNLPKHTNNS